MTDSTLDDIRALTEERAKAQHSAEQLDELWRGLIRNALLGNQRASDIAIAAGISRERVYQIRDGRR
jgi:hypothetical protein